MPLQKNVSAAFERRISHADVQMRFRGGRERAASEKLVQSAASLSAETPRAIHEQISPGAWWRWCGDAVTTMLRTMVVMVVVVVDGFAAKSVRNDGN